MSSFNEIIGLIETTALALGLEYVVSDGFEINDQSINFEAGKVILIRDVGTRNSINTIPGQINTQYPQNLLFVTDYDKDENQAGLDTVHSTLKSIVDSFMFNLNNNSVLKAANITGYNDSGGKFTDNYFYGIRVTFNFSTQCNL